MKSTSLIFWFDPYRHVQPNDSHTQVSWAGNVNIIFAVASFLISKPELQSMVIVELFVTFLFV